jgi:acetolactate synthase regulatory subunit
MDRDMTTRLYDERQLRREFRRGFDLCAVSQNKSVDIAAAGERELLHLTAQRRKLLRIVDRGR